MKSTPAGGPVTVGVSRSEASRGALLWAADEAAWRGLPLHLVHAQEWPPGTSPQVPPSHPAHLWSTQFRTTGERLLDEARVRAVERHPGLAVTTQLAEGRIVRVLREAAEHASQLVLGAKRLTESDLLFVGHGKGVALLGHVPCPLALVPQERANQTGDGPVVVGVVDRLRHLHRSSRARAVPQGHLAAWNLGVLHQKLPARAKAADAFRELAQWDHIIGYRL